MQTDQNAHRIAWLVVFAAGLMGAAMLSGAGCVTTPTPTPTPTTSPTPTPTPGDTVVVTTSVQGDPVPGGTVTVTATVDAQDGSTVESIAWTQSNSVPVTITGADTATATVAFAEVGVYKEELLRVLAEPPITAEQLPPNVPLPEGEFPAGLQNRYQIAGISPFSLEEAAAVTLTVTVTTTSGTYTADAPLVTVLPWQVASDIHNVPVGKGVLLQGKAHTDADTDGIDDVTGAATTYNWALAAPAGSSATLADATTRNPYFTPDVSGKYTVTVTDTTALPGDAVVTLEIYAGTWAGAISGQNAEGRPLAASCTICHNDTVAPDKFTPWMATGHAEIFTDNLNTSTHYSASCFPCHTVGYDPAADNSGVDEAADYQDFLGAGLLNVPGDNWTTVLAEFPETARLANVQCENCHGPNNGGAHFTGAPRISLSADVCAVCHGEPLRHGRFQQWQLSRHANYELAIDEGDSGSCSRCHTANGFLTWLPILLDDDPATDPLADITVSWTPDETHPQTCTACHDPHSIGTTTGVETNATVRISGDTPPLIAGFTATDVGRGAICMTCHNSRRGLHNDGTYDEIVATNETTRAPHPSVQADVLMGENAYFVETGARGPHSVVANVADTCVTCHMVTTPPPDLLSYQLGGTNHTFFASSTICSECHGDTIDGEALKTLFVAASDELKGLVEQALVDLVGDQIAAGNTIDLGGERTIASADEIAGLEFTETRGRQAITVSFTDETTVGPVALNSVNVVAADATVVGGLYDVADERLVKAAWNYQLTHGDGSFGAHNPSFVTGAMSAARDALTALAAE